MMRRLYYLGKPADGFGWGVANTNLVKALDGAGVDVVICDDQDRTTFDAPVFVPVADSKLTPIRKIKRAPRVLGYCFTEWPLKPEAKRNARVYDVLFAGSSWNTQRLLDAGVRQAQTLVQGVDFDRFQPHPPSERKSFVVFSGGKYEFRKSQDIVVAAMKIFMKQHSDVTLMTAWHNPWTSSTVSMANTWLLDDWKKPLDGLDRDRVVALPSLKNSQMPQVYAYAHVGLFPNRCEAGTNMPMMEFMACHRTVIASDAHGHRDVLRHPGMVGLDLEAGRLMGPYRLTEGSSDPAGWFNPNISDILYCLEHAYENRSQLERRAAVCRKLVERFTWSASASKVAREAFQ